MFCGLVIIIKNFNSVNSRRCWPPILISHFFSMAFFKFLATTFSYQGWDIVSFSAYKLVVIRINKDKEPEINDFSKTFALIKFTQLVNRLQV